MLNTTNIFGLRRVPAKTNLQRQREFVARNPHYYRDRTRRKKAEQEARLAAQAAALAEAVVETPPTVLALPAPEEVSNPTVTITLPDAFVYEPVKLTPPEVTPEVAQPESGVKPQATPPPGTPGRED